MSSNDNSSAKADPHMMVIPTEDLIVMHLFEARRLALTMAKKIDNRLFGYMIDMAADVAMEGRVKPVNSALNS
ncbi:hypothetical protein [Chelativorans sp. J32]|uniref:hypothetical protein n=1 Tax=Chelativorans sp. J32 TaxID=935840 RepID=UPI000486418A|nr:hypothetical protein [Chelativorans sp. J32]